MRSIFVVPVQLSQKSWPLILPSLNGIVTQVKFALMLTLIRLLLSVNSSRGISMLKTASSRGPAHISDPGFQVQNNQVKHGARHTLGILFAGC